MKSAIKMRIFTTVIVLGICAIHNLNAQFIPVVYDNIYGRGVEFSTAGADFQNGDFVSIGKENDKLLLSWIGRDGATIFNRSFAADDFSVVNSIIPLSESSVLIVGSRKLAPRGERNRATGRAMILSSDGTVVRNIHVGEEGTVFTSGKQLANGNLILVGSTPYRGGMAAVVTKVSPENKVLYNYIAGVGETCQWFDVLGSHTEFVNAAFSYNNKQGSSVVRLDENGKPYFIANLPDPSFKITKMTSTSQGEIYLVGVGERTGGAVIKIRPEGDIVFHKQIVPVGSGVVLDKLLLSNSGEILVGGNDASNAYYALLRSDGTDISFNVDKGAVASICHNATNGDSFVSLYNTLEGKGRVVKFSKEGRRLFDKSVAANYTSLRLNSNGDLLMASPQSGRLSMLSTVGDLIFDRHVVEGTPTQFKEVYLFTNGETLFVGANNRVAKLAHGIYVGDITVRKPINGNTTAVFTVTLSGYSFNPEGAPLPVSVSYKTAPITASAGVNYDPVTGTLSFIPSTDGSDRYLNNFTIEVPVNANDLLEGNRTFTLNLSDVKHSYLIRSSGKATIQDQQAIVKLIGTTAGIEGEKDVTYQLGLFKTNGVALTNATKSDIVIDGSYGKGTADRLDFDMGRMPRLTIASGKHSGEFKVRTLDDTRYESTKSVVIDFDKVHAMSDTEVSFGSSVLSCSALLHDQAAVVAIESLGDHIKFNNALSGLFKITLLRAKDGVALTNNSGSDIVITPAVNAGTAKEGVDFILSNAYDLRIGGDDKSSAVNLNGMILFTPQKSKKNVSVSLKEVKGSKDAGPLSIAPNKGTAQFTIQTENQ